MRVIRSAYARSEHMLKLTAIFLAATTKRVDVQDKPELADEMNRMREFAMQIHDNPETLDNVFEEMIDFGEQQGWVKRKVPAKPKRK